MIPRTPFTYFLIEDWICFAIFIALILVGLYARKQGYKATNIIFSVFGLLGCIIGLIACYSQGRGMESYVITGLQANPGRILKLEKNERSGQLKLTVEYGQYQVKYVVQTLLQNELNGLCRKVGSDEKVKIEDLASRNAVYGVLITADKSRFQQSTSLDERTLWIGSRRVEHSELVDLYIEQKKTVSKPPYGFHDVCGEGGGVDTGDCSGSPSVGAASAVR